MIISTAPENSVELSPGVSHTSEFRIRNSAKAFGILSSGLYANKIRAIIREISCNAVDSHVAAGTPDLPFEVHLPTALSPYFWIRDFGIGLNHEEVTNIYTTYFESTKTTSNAFIGALGLGSKSPFSYTDNFTVTAIKDGVQRVYSAFINEQGVPSVALMGEGPTEEHNGVQVKFSVNDRDDFYRFKAEAEYVYQYFKVKPTVLGAQITIPEIKYVAENIIPGVSQRENDGHYNAENRAIMGNICYPIDIPKKKGEEDDGWGYNNKKSNPMAVMARAGLDIQFDIGEVEFQASREGLSYIQSTIDAIHAKYQAVLDSLEAKLAQELKDTSNVWDQAELLLKRANSGIWTEAAAQYQKKHPNPLIESDRYYGNRLSRKAISYNLDAVKTKYNIEALHFEVQYYARGRNNIRPLHQISADHKGNMTLNIYNGIAFVKHSDKKLKGYVSNLRYHFGNENATRSRETIVVAQAADDTKPVLWDDFYKDIFFSPPASILIEDKDLTVAPKIPRNPSARTINILAVGKHYSKGELAWAEVGQQPDKMDASKTYYYVPMKGFQVTGPTGDILDIKYTFTSFTKCYPNTAMDLIYGVRKGDLDVVEALPNWKPAFEFIEEQCKNLSPEDFYRVALNVIDRRVGSIYTNERVRSKITDKGSAFLEFGNKLSKMQSTSIEELKDLCVSFAPKVDIKDLEEKATQKAKEVNARYPMLELLDHLGWDSYQTVAGYVNLIDSTHKE